ncbi:MAG: hypothetical protein JW740_01240 [Candidatus Zambryskibacteria bacterium]|nr:hypothetical protein [Candidatus Zambryskibacteria bacterium]
MFKEFKEPLLIILVLFVLFGFAYSPLKKTSLQKNSGGSASTISTNDNQDQKDNKNISDNIKDIEKEIKTLEKNINKKIEESQRSPYYGKVMMSSISGIYQDDPNQEYTQLRTNLNKGETVNITGWYLKSEITGYGAVIGGASLLPFPFTHSEEDIILRPGDRVYLTKGFSPIGISFRTNKCTGFFEENRTFTPNLSLNCPRPIDEDLPTFSTNLDANDECLEIIERIPRCRTRDTWFLKNLPDTVNTTCRNYIKTQINYNTCVANHFGDFDFPGNEYRIYLGKFGPLWRERADRINLYDRNGLIVDIVSY